MSKKRKFDNDNKYEYIEIKKEINSLDDLIELGKMYDRRKRKRYNINLRLLSYLVKPLTKLKNVIGMEEVKITIVNHIIYYIQDLEDNSKNMLHTVIQGPPGVGKSMLGKIIGDIYYNLGLLKTKNYTNYYPFKIAKRSDLIGRYLGETAIKTQEVIDECYGGVLFIDEAYSLGNEEKRDTFSKECIDTINQNLTENKGNFLCIIAGYKDSLEKCFFSYNDGLRRRFPFIYTIDNYTPSDLEKIFIKMVLDIRWNIKDIDSKFFETNYEYFENFGGDMETLLFNVKIEHSKRVLCLDKKEKKIINQDDLENGFREFKKNKKIVKTDDNKNFTNMYL